MATYIHGQRTAITSDWKREKKKIFDLIHIPRKKMLQLELLIKTNMEVKRDNIKVKDKDQTI